MENPEQELTLAQIERERAEIERLSLVSEKLRLDCEYSRLRNLEEGEAIHSRRYREYEQNTYVFYDDVSRHSVRECMKALSHWSRREPGCEMKIVLNSPGGSVIDGLALYDLIDRFVRDGHRVEVQALGMAASMGGVLLQAGSHRTMGKNAFVLIHEVSSIGLGSLTEIEDELQFLKKLQARCVSILSEKSDLTPAVIQRKWKRKDWWLSSEECLSLNLIDEVI